MQLPGNIEISRDKILHYLLSYRKKNDKSKWPGSAGYTQENWDQLNQDLYKLIKRNDAVLSETDKYGPIYQITGKLSGPNGVTLSFTTIWMSEHFSRKKKFITMFPTRR